MNPEMSALNALFEHALEPEVYSFRLLDALIKEALRRGVTAFPVHIKFDTGMHRLGFEPNDVPELCRRLEQTTRQRHRRGCRGDKRCPVVGNICMDACMLDVTDATAAEGDIVTFFDENLTVNELADKIGTIPYEILTSISLLPYTLFSAC